jgi:hypothetical protein
MGVPEKPDPGPQRPERPGRPLRSNQPEPVSWVKILGVGALVSLVGTLVLLAVVFIFIISVCKK